MDAKGIDRAAAWLLCLGLTLAALAAMAGEPPPAEGPPPLPLRHPCASGAPCRMGSERPSGPADTLSPHRIDATYVMLLHTHLARAPLRSVNMLSLEQRMGSADRAIGCGRNETWGEVILTRYVDSS